MKKRKDKILTNDEKKVVKNNKVIVLLLFVLMASMALNVYMYINKPETAIKEDTFATKIENTLKVNNNEQEKNDEILLQETLDKAYAEAEVFDEPIKSVRIVGDGCYYNIYWRADGQINFSNDFFGNADFVREKGVEFLDILNKHELRIMKVISYVDSDGMVVSYKPDRYLVINNKTIFEPNNWNEIIDYCKQMDEIINK